MANDNKTFTILFLKTTTRTIFVSKLSVWYSDFIRCLDILINRVTHCVHIVPRKRWFTRLPLRSWSGFRDFTVASISCQKRACRWDLGILDYTETYRWFQFKQYIRLIFKENTYVYTLPFTATRIRYYCFSLGKYVFHI